MQALQNENALLKLENDALRSQLSHFEERLDNYARMKEEENTKGVSNQREQPQPQQPQQQQKRQQPNKPPPSSTQADIVTLRKLLTEINLAKRESMIAKKEAQKHSPYFKASNNSRSADNNNEEKNEELYDLLTQQGVENKMLMNKVKGLEGDVTKLTDECSKVEQRKATDKVIFIEMLKRERRESVKKLDAAVDAAAASASLENVWFKNEFQKIRQWASDRQQDYLTATNELQTMLTNEKLAGVEIANNLNLDLARELEGLRQEASELATSASAKVDVR
jgi:hypothetical protein